MKDISRIKPDEFEALLNWFSDDREKAGEEYIQIRNGLIRFFRAKGCSDAPSLADETMTRVAEKFHTLDTSQVVKKITIFYGFASKIFLEYFRIQKRQTEKLNRFAAERDEYLFSFDNPNKAKEVGCLNECMKNLTPEEREIFVRYYADENGKKTEARRELARHLHCEMNTLQVRIFRLRGSLRKCIEKCLKKTL